ncbi:MAG: hypothetical protein IPH31_14060 [Lewinellaceae bacterium]|nr:hypothetical protein [Lewinellaceae bacterium]
MERLALFQLGFEKIGFEIFINSTDLINKIKTNPYSGEWVMIVDKQSRDTRIEVLNIKNKDKVLKNYDVFKLEKVFGNKILTATDLYRSNRRDNLNNICYRPVFSNVDVDLDWFIPTASFKKLKEKTKISVFLCHSFDDKKM